MGLLLDTHVLLWAALEPHQLSEQQRNALEDSDNALLVSAASAWEIATKWRLGKLSQAGQVVHNDSHVLNALAASELAINGQTARTAGLLDMNHSAPCDRAGRSGHG